MNLPDDYMLMRADETAKDTCRTVYNLACQDDGFTGSEPPQLMFRRAGRFLYKYADTLDALRKEVLFDCGYIGGIIEDDINTFRDLSVEQCVKLNLINAARWECEKIIYDLSEVIFSWGTKEWSK